MERDGLVPEPSLFERAWPLTGVSIGEALPSFPTRRVFSIGSDEGAFVAKVTPSGDPDEPQANTLFVLEYLAERGFRHAPALLRTSRGYRFELFGDASFSIVEYLPRTVDDGASPTETWRSLGEVAPA